MKAEMTCPRCNSSSSTDDYSRPIVPATPAKLSLATATAIDVASKRISALLAVVHAADIRPPVVGTLVVHTEVLHHCLEIASVAVNDLLASREQTILLELWTAASLPVRTANVAELGSAQAPVSLSVNVNSD